MWENAGHIGCHGSAVVGELNTWFFLGGMVVVGGEAEFDLPGRQTVVFSLVGCYQV